MRRILLCAYVDGDTRVTIHGTALLIGVTVEDLLARWDPSSGAETIPADWQRRGSKRTLHARNATGTNVANVNLAFLAARDWGARIDFDETAGQMWAVVDDPAGQLGDE